MRDTTVLRLLTYVWELELRVAELEGDAAQGDASSRPEPLTRDELDGLLGVGHDAWGAEYPMPEADQRRLGELAVRAWQLLAGGYDT